MNGATAVPLVSTMSPPNRAMTMNTGSSQYFLRSSKNAANSRRKEIIGRSELVHEAVGRRARRLSRDPVAFAQVRGEHRAAHACSPESPLRQDYACARQSFSVEREDKRYTQFCWLAIPEVAASGLDESTFRYTQARQASLTSPRKINPKQHPGESDRQHRKYHQAEIFFHLNQVQFGEINHLVILF